MAAPFAQLDFLYCPSEDVAAEASYFIDVLGGELVFAIESGGTRVAAVQLTAGPPLFLLADHVEGDRPIFVYRVEDLAASLAELQARGWQPAGTFEIPHGPCCSIRTAGGHRVALYQLTRPEVAAHFEGRRDFLNPASTPPLLVQPTRRSVRPLPILPGHRPDPGGKVAAIDDRRGPGAPKGPRGPRRDPRRGQPRHEDPPRVPRGPGGGGLRSPHGRRVRSRLDPVVRNVPRAPLRQDGARVCAVRRGAGGGAGADGATCAGEPHRRTTPSRQPPAVRDDRDDAADPGGVVRDHLHQGVRPAPGRPVLRFGGPCRTRPRNRGVGGGGTTGRGHRDDRRGAAAALLVGARREPVLRGRPVAHDPAGPRRQRACDGERR